MINLIRPLRAALLVLCAGFSVSALAHNPMCECKAIDAEQIKCTGGFSDGSGAPGVTLDVIGYVQEARRRVLCAVRRRPWPRGRDRPSGHRRAMSNPTTQIVRPAGAGHETLNVLLLCLMILAIAGSVVAWRHAPQDVSTVSSHQLDARRDLSASEQGIYADLRVTLDEIHLLRQEQQTLPSPEALADEGFAPFAQDASSVSRGGHAWQLLADKAYIGQSQTPTVAGSFLMRLTAGDDAPDIWLNRATGIKAPADLTDAALESAGWQQIVAQFDAGVTRQHRH
jgi:hypothetical protein